MITDEKKKRIESLSTDEMLYEINLGNRSRFQGKKFAYLKTCYQKRLEQNELKKRLNSSILDDVKQNLRQFKYQNYEVPVVREWIQEQEKLTAQNKTTKKPRKKTNTIHNWHEKPLGKIAIGVIITILAFAVAWVLNHYLGLRL
jgi:hypothetical protein